LDDDTLNIEFNDMSLDVRASLNVIETETWAVVSDFKINYVGVQEWIFKDRYYNNVESIGSWLPSNRETRDYEGESYN
jgi:hypothetical protein